MSQEVPLITTIIPTYRRPHLLKRAIKSVLNQTFKNLQVCVFDNASGDETREIVEIFMKDDERVKYHCHNENIGSAKNFQFGLSSVNTTYFSFLSDDDFLLPGFYETGIKQLKKYPEAGLFSGKTIIVDDKNRVQGVRRNIQNVGFFSVNETLQKIAGRYFSIWTSIIFNHDKAKKIGPLDSSLVVSDTDYILRMMFNYPIILSDINCAVFFSHSSSISYAFNIADVWPAMDIISKKLAKITKIENHLMKQVDGCLRRYSINHIYNLGKQAIKNDNKQISSKTIELLNEEFQEFNLTKKLVFYSKLRKTMLWNVLLFFKRTNPIVTLLNCLKFPKEKSLLLKLQKSLK